MKKIILLFFLLFTTTVLAEEKILNVYIWAGEVPDEIIRQFEKETGIEVNYSTYDSNETLYAKLRATGNPGYDVIEPSSYYIDRMRREGMLIKLNKHKLSHYNNLDPDFINPAYDPQSEFSVPYLWGITGIFINKNFFPTGSVKSWRDLWNKKYYNQLLMLDDPRELFSLGLIVLGYSINDTDPQHIRAAYLELKKLLPNIKLFNADAAIPVVIDDDATVGMIWNGDLFKAKQENSALEFIYPEDGYWIWVDAFAIPKDAPHPENAYKFLDFMLRAEIAKEGTLSEGYAIANRAGRNLLPPELKNDPIIYPADEVVKRAQFQTDVGDEQLELYEKYWELLKIGG